MKFNPGSALLLGISMIINACGDAPGTPDIAGPNAAVTSQPVAMLRVTAGNFQSGAVGTLLPQKITVQAVDAGGIGVRGAIVRWDITAGGGSVSPRESITDESGMASTSWTLGSLVGEQRVRAQSGLAAPVIFRATGTAGNPPGPAVGSLVLSPQSLTLDALNAQTTLAATTYDTSGQVVTGQRVGWTSSDPLIASVDSTGRVTAKAVGTAQIIASASCCNKADTAAVTVRQVVSSVTIAPRTASVPVGGNVQLQATGKDANGFAIPSLSVTWSSASSAIATVNSQGLVTGLVAGTARIRAVSGSVGDSATVTVSAPTSVLTTITLTPTNATLLVGNAQTFTATGRDQNGNVMTGIPFTWSSSNPSVMTVNNGTVTAVAVGVATLSVSSGNVRASTQVSVATQSAGTYAQHNFNDGTLGPFTTLSGGGCNSLGQCGADTWVRNGQVEIRYERLDLISAGDRNRGIKWVPRSSAENTPFGGTLYVGGTWTIPSMTSAVRTKIDAVAQMLGLPAQTDFAYERMQRKLIYVNPGRSNYFFMKIHGLNLSVHPGVAGGAPCSTNPAHPGYVVYRFTPAELFDKPQRIEMELKRSSGIRIADGEVKVWLNGVLIAHKTGFCTNADNNTSWQVQLGQQMSYTRDVGEIYSEMRFLDDVRIANRR